ncbi:Xylose isomerase-like TIM barrel [anaerobic digester metagenome]
MKEIRLSISNIAWDQSADMDMYPFLMEQGFCGIEIAPTRFFQTPYEKTEQIRQIAETLQANYNLCISSMQSIWYGRSEKLFGNQAEREKLLAYMRQAIDFATACNCRNLVFGCPKNRIVPEGAAIEDAVSFFSIVGAYAKKHDCVIALEPNPTIYGTNFMTTTKETVQVVRAINSDGIKVNLDIGAMIYNGESVADLVENEDLIHHVHISEPQLKQIQPCNLHRQIIQWLQAVEYRHFLSIEMANIGDLDAVKKTCIYVKSLLTQG